MVYIILLLISAFGAFQSFRLKESTENYTCSIPKDSSSENIGQAIGSA